MNQNEAGNNELNKSEPVNESDKDKKTNEANESAFFCEVLADGENKKHVSNDSKTDPTADKNSVDEVRENIPTTLSTMPPISQCNTIDDAMSTTKEAAAAADDDVTSSLRPNNVEEQPISAVPLLPIDDITSPSTIADALITATTTTIDKTVASPITSPAAVVAAADGRHLQHVASAPALSCILLRANQQQQQKIKCYHDAKQTALWDTKSSTSSGGAILKSGISSNYGSPKMIRKLSESSSCNLLPRRVSFPKSDKELVTGYLEPANPWEYVATVNSVSEIADLYVKSCLRHNTRPLPDILDQLKSVELNKLSRQPMLTLKKVQLQPADCEALEEILKRVQYKCIDLSSCQLEESAISALCDIIEYYEAANELNISTNPKGMTYRGWVSCANMVGRSQELQVLNAEGNPMSKSNAESFGNALNSSNLHTVKLEHCGLKGAPLNGLCLKIRQNKTLKELWLAHNDLDCRDAESIAELLKVNHYLELVDISNNNIGDEGLKHIVEALIVQSKELERRSMFQRTAAIDDDIFSPVETTANSDEATKFDHEIVNEELSNALFASTKSDGNTTATCKDSDYNGIIEERSKENYETDVLIPDLDAFSMEIDAISLEVTAATIDETEAEDDTEDTVKSNTVKSKQLPSLGGGSGQSMLDKLLSMNSDSSSEEGVSNLSTDTIAACGSDDTSFVSDDIFDAVTTTNTTNTCTNSKVNTSANTATATTATIPQSLTNETVAITSFGSPANQLRNNYNQKNGEASACGEKTILCDTCTLEANDHCESNGDNKRTESLNSMTLHCCHNNYNNNNTNNNNYNPNIVQNQQNNFREVAHNQEILTEETQCMNDESPHESATVFEVTAEETDCLVPCTSVGKSNVMLLQNSTSAVDVNKNTRLAEDYDDTHSTDSAFESASEGDISRTLPEEFTRLSTSLESTRLDEIAKEFAIETATIATESTEYLSEAGTTPVVFTTSTSNTLPPLVKVGTQKSDEIKTKDVEVRFCETILVESNEASQTCAVVASNVAEHECSLPKVTIETESVTCVKRCEDNNSPIPTPPPPSTSPGGAGLSMRRTDSSCNFITQSTRNHSQSSDSLCSDNSLDGSVSSDLNLSTSAQLNEKLTKNDTLTRQQRQCDTTADCSHRAPGGLKALAVWNNNLTKEAGLYIADLLADTTSLELLNIGKNCLSNEFVLCIKESLTKNTTLTTFGLQSAHLSTKGIETLSSILAFGGNSTLQRIDIRDNKLEIESLTTLADALKSNTTVTQIDIDDEPKRLSVGSDAHLDYVRVTENIRSMCSRNEKTQLQQQAERTANSASSTKRRGGYYVGSRKISLTCHSRPLIEHSVASAVTMPSGANKLEVKRKTGVRLRSPVPSPPTISPSSSPNRSRFQVFRVNEVSPLTSPATNSAPIPTLSYSADSSQDGAISSSSSLTTSTSLPSMATVTSSIQTVRRHASSPRSRFHVSKIYEDPKVPLAKRSLPPLTPPIHLPPTPMMKSAPKTNTLRSNESSVKEQENCTDTISTSMSTSNNLFTNITIDTIDANDSIEKAQPSRCPIAVFNENDITLTHSSANEILLIPSASVGSNDTTSKADVSTTENAISSTATQQVARKVSWIGNPTAVDKLLTLFQNPGTIFQRSSSPEPKNVPTNASAAASSEIVTQAIQATNQTQNSIVPSLKQSSPPTWSKLASDMSNVTIGDAEKTVTTEQPKSFLGAASKQLRDFGKQVFRQNVTATSESSNICSADNLLSIIPIVSSDGNDDVTTTTTTTTTTKGHNSKLENLNLIELRPTDMTTESTESISSEAKCNKEHIIHQTQNPIASEDKTEISVAAQLEDTNVSASGMEEPGINKNAE